MSTMDDWISALKSEFDLDLDLDIHDVLDVTKVAAHNVARPAAPVTAFLVGFAAARAGGDAAAIEDVCRRTTSLAESWPNDE